MYSLPALIKVFSVFGLILLLNRARLTLGVCMLLGAAVLALWMKMPPNEIIRSISVNLVELQTLGLVIIVGIILIITQLMKDTGQLERIVNCFSRLFSDDRASGAFMAALIGLLPMPGGALFSAPMVDAAFSKRSLSGEAKTAINYWFRHIWEYWWPLYPGVVLAVALLDVPTWRFMAFMAPMTIVSAFAGLFFILRPLGRSPIRKGWENVRLGIRPFLWEVMPIMIVVLVIVAQAALLEILKRAGLTLVIPGAVSIFPGLVAALVWVSWVNRVSLRKVRAAVIDKHIPPLLFLVAAIMVFKGVLEDSQVVFQVRSELVAFSIPTVLIIMIMPLLSGFITGIAIGFVGVSFPLIIPLFPNNDMSLYLAHTVLAYSFGYMGMMLSPVHLCFLVTKNYYNANLAKCYRYLIQPAAVVMLCSVLIFLIITAY